MKDNDPTLLETTGVGSVEEMKKMYLSYRKDITARIRRAEVTGKVVWGCLFAHFCLGSGCCERNERFQQLDVEKQRQSARLLHVGAQ